MKRRILAFLGLTSIALVASVISLNTSKEAPAKETEEVFAAEDPNTNWGGMRAVPFADRYETNWTSEPKYTTQNPLQFSTMDIGDVWKNYQGFESGTEPVKVAIIDSGINIYHEDFLTPEARNVNITASNVKNYSILDPKSCYIHDNSGGYYSSSVVTEVGIDKAYDTDTYDDDYNEYYSHGTASAACVGAAINGAGGLGIAPKCELLIIRMDFYFTSLDKAIRYAADNGADVINMSLGAYAETFTDGYGDEQEGDSSIATALTSAINYALDKDCVVVAAAGNEATPHKSYPACNAGVIGVGALDKKSKNNAAGFSNFNLNSDTSSTNNNVDVMAPGYVYTANMDSENGPKTGSNLRESSYQETQGTSFASPLTAGAIALARSKFPELSHTEIEQRLFSTCNDIGTSGWDKNFGYGRVNISNLIGLSYDVEDITLDNTSLNLYNNDTIGHLTADVVPSSATNKLIHWTSSVTSVATVPATSNAGAEINVTPKGVGTTTITAYSDFDNTILKQCTVTVNSYISSEFTFSATKTTLMEGESIQTSISFANPNPTSTEILYESSNESVATVSDSGLVTAVSEGSATITAMSADDMQELNFTVTLDPTKGSATIEFGDWPSGGTSGSGSSLSVTKSIFSMSLDKGYNSGSEIRNYAGGKVTVSITNGTILSFSITAISGNTGAALTMQSGGGSVSLDGSTIKYQSGATPSSSVSFKNGSQLRFTNTTIVYKSNIDPTVQYTVTFNGNGGSNPTSQTVASGTIITLPTSTRTDYTFLGWSTSSTATSATYSGNSSFTVNANVTLYAVWGSSGGGETQEEETTTYGFTDKTWADSTSSWTGTKNGSNYESTDSKRGVQITTSESGVTVSTNSSISNISKISISVAKSKKGVGSVSVKIGSEQVLNITSFQTTLSESETDTFSTTKSGVVSFTVTCTTSSLYVKSVTIVTGGGGDTPTTNYTVSFNKNGGEGTMENKTTTGSTYVVPACAFSAPSGMTFDKWALNSASGTKYSVGSTITGISSNITLYATWTESGGGGGDDSSYWTSWIASNTSAISTGGPTLVTALRTKISNVAPGSNNTLSYDDLWDAYATTDSIPGSNGTKIYDMYGGFEFRKGTDQAGSYQDEGDVYNREHSVPKSWFGEKAPAISDLIHVVPTDGKVNGMRSNYTFGEVANASYSYPFPARSYNGVQYQTAGISKLGTPKAINGVTTSQSTVFEPDDQYKGDFARIYMYFAVRYGGTTCSPTTGAGSAIFTGTCTESNPYVTNYGLALLKKWHEQDPVSEKERIRNNGVEAKQGNRNPFVDYPEWADKIFGTSTSTPKVNSIALNPTSLGLDLFNNVSDTVSASVSADQGAQYTVSWTSSEPSVATVSGNNSGATITAKGVGSTTITAQAGDETATCTVTVSDSTPIVTGISLDSTKTLDLNGGATGTLTPTVTKVGNPSYTISWSSSNSGVVEVDQSGNLTAKSTGSADITASISSSISATCTVTVIDTTPIVHDVEIDEETVPTNLDVYTNKTGTITLKINADDGADYTVEWTSSDESVATVTPIVKKNITRAASVIEASATITAVGAGTTTITASAGGQSSSYDLTIADSTPVAVTGVSLDKETAKIQLGGKVVLTPTIEPFDAANKNVTWSSSAPSIASVSLGTVTGISAGTAVITVTTVDGGYTASCTVTVTKVVKKYQLTLSKTTFVFAEDEGSSLVSADISEVYTDNTSKVIETTEVSIDTMKLGSQSVSTTYNGKTISANYTVTNSGSGGTIGYESSDNATPEQQAEAWAIYFIEKTRTDSTCLAKTDSARLAGLKTVWSNLSSEYGNMVDASKDAFCSDSASSKIKEALQHYQYIISKFTVLSDFVTNAKGEHPEPASSKYSLKKMFTTENGSFVTVLFSVIAIVSIAGFVLYRKRKMY